MSETTLLVDFGHYEANVDDQMDVQAAPERRFTDGQVGEAVGFAVCNACSTEAFCKVTQSCGGPNR